MNKAAGLALTCVLTIGGFVGWSWPLAKSVSTDTLVNRKEEVANDFSRAAQADWGLILANDQTLSMWGATENARSLTSGHWSRLMRQGQCWPMPQSTALGEHMLELGVLAAPWWLATHNPVETYNFLFVTALLIAASGMFLFVHRQTNSTAASIVGALAFAFATPRLVDLPYHPAVVGTHWIPWVLLFFERSLAREGAGSLVLFGIALLLSGLVGSYPLIAIAIVGGAYGAAALYREWQDGELERRTVLRCCAAATPAVLVVGLLLATYGLTQSEWMLMPNGGGKFVVSVWDYLPGGLMSVGAVSILGTALVVVLRGDEGHRATAGLTLAAALAAFVATAIASSDGQSISLFEIVASRVALLDSVRAPGKVGLAVCFAVQALGAIGWSRLFARVGNGASAGIAAALVLLIGLEALPPAPLQPVMGKGAPMELRPAASPKARVEAIGTALSEDDRPVLDLPIGRMVKAPLQLLDAAYHGHETSACYNSLVPPTMRAAYSLLDWPHTGRNVAELAAAGFGYVIERSSSPTRPIPKNSYPEPARLVAYEDSFAIWAMPPSEPVHHDVSKLSFRIKGGATRKGFYAPDPPFEVDIEVTNNSETMWALGDPPTPLVGSLALESAGGSPAFLTRARGVLPLALTGGQTTTIQLVTFEAPAPGAYRATVTLDGIGALPASDNFVWSDH